MAKNVRMEWRQGSTGLGAVYIFNPKPNITREEAALKQAEFDIPLLDGVVIQDLGREKRVINLSGALFVKTTNFEDLEDKRDALVSGIGRTDGQLHIFSITNVTNPKHVFYKGQIASSGVQFKEQINPYTLEYEIQIICADPTEYKSQTKTITSNAKVV